MKNSCGRCHATWSGLSAAHCAAECHITFTSVSAFDMHRKDGACREPEAVGLVLRDRGGWSGWGRPTTNPDWHSDSRPHSEP